MFWWIKMAITRVTHRFAHSTACPENVAQLFYWNKEVTTRSEKVCCFKAPSHWLDRISHHMPHAECKLVATWNLVFEFPKTCGRKIFLVHVAASSALENPSHVSSNTHINESIQVRTCILINTIRIPKYDQSIWACTSDWDLYTAYACRFLFTH